LKPFAKWFIAGFLRLMVVSGALAQAHAGALQITRVEARDGAWILHLDFGPNAAVLEALDASVPLKFVLTQRGKTDGNVDDPPDQSITLSYSPLLERFELNQGDSAKRFRLRAELLDAFTNLRLPIAAGVTQVRLALSIGALPAPLRLPALLDSDWWLDTGWVVVP
jgi:hypothetical protein